MIWPPGQSVGLVKGAGFVDDGEIVLGEEEGPTGLTAGKFLFGAKVGQVVMIGPDFERKGVAFEIVAERFESTDDGKEFFIMNVVILFGG